MTTTIGDLERLTERLAPITLDELDESVSLQIRTDRKYVIASGLAHALVDQRLATDARVLEIDGRRVSGYESVYFDTPAFDSYLGAARRRPDRFKVRTRRYVDDGSCWVEIKQRTRRDQNHKLRRTHDPGRPASLTPESLEFVSSCPRIGSLAVRLAPVVRTQYRRTTLKVGVQRVTVDAGLVCDDLAGDAVGIGELMIVETKSAGGPGAVDRALWALGCRPVRISKFAIAVASFHPSLPDHRWHRVLSRFVTPCPAGAAAIRDRRSA